MSPRGCASALDVPEPNRVINRNMLRLNLAQISDALRIAATRQIDALTGNDEIPQELEKLRKVAIVHATKDRQMEPEVGVHGVAASLNVGLDRPKGGVDLHEIVACATLGGKPRGFDFQARSQFEDLQHVLCGPHSIRIDTERAAPDVDRDERATALVGDN